MLTIRKAGDRGKANYGWLETNYTFSFANYYDPQQLGFRSLRVLNEDVVEPGAGFETHAHRNMEIITYLLEGALEHQDSLGHGSVIRPGEIQRMSAGTGILHSEFNHSQQEPVHLLQIWLIPNQSGVAPSYEQKPINLLDPPGKLQLIGAESPPHGAVKIHQDLKLYAGKLCQGDRLTHCLLPNRYGWLQLVRGAITLNDHPLHRGDGVAISDESQLSIIASQAAELLLFDLA